MTMKFKTSKRGIKDNYNKIISIGYCNAQYLLNYQQPIAYSTRAEGWACDYYDVNNVLISTGYAPLDAKNSKVDYEMLQKYDKKACEIVGNYSIEREERVKQVEVLLKEFIKEAVGDK